MWGLFNLRQGDFVSTETLWRKWWILSCLLYWRVKPPLLIVLQTADSSTVKCSCNSLKALKWSHWQLCVSWLPQAWLTAAHSIEMKARTSSCTTDKAGRCGCITSVCCALRWLTVHLQGHMKELTIAESTKGWRADCPRGRCFGYWYLYNW